MYTINIKGKSNPKDRKMVKLEMIFFKSGYARVPKVLEVTGLLKDWDAKSQSFRVGSFEATTKNKILFDLRTQYHHIADKWEAEERNWSPVQLAHALDEVKTIKAEVKVKSVQQMIEFLEAKFREKKKVKNGQIVDSTTNAKRYKYLLRVLQQFTKEKYNKSFSTYFFADINEQFLLDFSFWIKEQGVRNGNKGGLTHKLRLLRAVCNYARKQEMYGVDVEAFACLGDDIRWPKTTSKAVSGKVIEKIANVDRTLFTAKENLHLDLFLFSYYTGGMANVDVCNLTWDLIQEDCIIYERIKFPKTAMEKIQPRHERRKLFWQEFIQYCRDNDGVFANITPQGDSWISKGIKVPYGIYMCAVIGYNFARIEIYFNSGNKDINKKVFDYLYSRKDEIESEYGHKLSWQRLTDKIACRIKDEREYHCFDAEDRTEIFAFLKDASDKMSVIFHNFILDYKE